jgi:hypothetical protein
MQKYHDGIVYEGAWRDGKRHGQGKYTYADGAVYEGEWCDDKRHGRGKYTYADADGVGVRGRVARRQAARAGQVCWQEIVKHPSKAQSTRPPSSRTPLSNDVCTV